MLITKKNRITVYSNLFKEGVMVVEKDVYKVKHSDELDIPNLEVMLLLRSLSSKKLVRETFNWGWYYYYLTNEGVEYLREYLALPVDLVPATHRGKAGAAVPSGRPERGDKKSAGPGGDFKPEFQKKDGYRS